MGRVFLIAVVLLLAAPAVALALPQTTIDSGPPAFSNSPNATFVFSSDDPSATFSCTLDGGLPTTPCASPLNISGLSESQHTFAVEARDVGGNPDPTPASYTWTVDFTPPDTVLSAAPPSLTSSTTATFEFSSPDAAASFQCSLNGAPFGGCTSPQTFAGLSDGTRSFTVRAVDPATNVDISPPATAWTVDATPPDTTITAGPPAQSNATQPVLQFASSEAGGTFECSLNGGPFAGCSSPHTLSGLVQGPVGFQVRAIDGAGNVDATPASRAWTLDATPPPVPGIHVGPRPQRRRSGRQRRRARPHLLATTRFQKTRELRVDWGVLRGAQPASYDVEYRLSRSGTNPVGNWTAFRTNTTNVAANAIVNPGFTGCFRAHATDAVGNNSEWRTACTTIPYEATDAKLTVGWFPKTGGGYYGGQFAFRPGPPGQAGFASFLRLTVGSQNPSQAQQGLVNVKRIALLATSCPDCGKVRVIVTADGTLPIDLDDAVVDKTIDLDGATTRRTRLFTVATFASANPATQHRRFVYLVASGNGDRRVEGIGVSIY